MDKTLPKAAQDIRNAQLRSFRVARMFFDLTNEIMFSLNMQIIATEEMTDAELDAIEKWIRLSREYREKASR